ncbi:hypothetical protein H2203_007650 [Taxawa tesnikishii (nom. ined.)]|nr:hypothetical protein H2203_007650 [Dothideales sp. JES 119]
MPDKPLTIATYAAGASLAAITLVYVFGPTFFLDDDAAQSSKSSRKKGVVGLSNPANDCFINSVLQTLAGLPELRMYLIRELHRRKLDGPEIYAILNDPVTKEQTGDTVDVEEREKRRNEASKIPEWKRLGLQQGMVTAALKEILDSLNERPIYKKTISAQGFIRVVEQAFRTRVSRQQQDAQEFLQVVMERLSDEYYAGQRARQRPKSLRSNDPQVEQNAPGINQSVNGNEETESGATAGKEMEDSEETIRPNKLSNGTTSMQTGPDSRENPIIPRIVPNGDKAADDAETDLGFPFEGKIESQIECEHCHYKYKPSVSSFVTLTLHVPQTSSTSLNTCFDGMLKVEHIDDFKCDRCRLQHALDVKKKDFSSASARHDPKKKALEADAAAIEDAIATDPETPPKNVTLPDPSLAPKRRISRHMRISAFPRVLAIHLNRSMWDMSTQSAKNMAKVSFPETLPLGGLLDQKSYRLLGVVTHKGGHNSGHYESFRRQVLREPYSTPATMGTDGIYSARGSPKASELSSPVLKPRNSTHLAATESPSGIQEQPALSSPLMPSESGSSASSRSSLSLRRRKPAPTSHPQQTSPSVDGERNPAANRASEKAKSLDLSRLRRKPKRVDNRWWRISDDKIKESKTNDVLGMQKEVYLLFYEMVLPETT